VEPIVQRGWAALSNLHRIGTRYEEARLDAERALEADPFLSDADVILFRLYESSLELKDIGEAVHWCEEGRRRFPADRNFHACALFLVALAAGPAPDVARGRALADTLVRSSPPQEREQIAIIAQTWVAAVLARAGRADSAAALVERSRAAAAGGLKPWIDYYAANVYLLLGRRERSLELIGAFLEAIPQRKTYVASDWMFQELWDDPRFQALVAPAPSAGR
jgi:serine/threonine-protein kinase